MESREIELTELHVDCVERCLVENPVYIGSESLVVDIWSRFNIRSEVSIRVRALGCSGDVVPAIASDNAFG